MAMVAKDGRDRGDRIADPREGGADALLPEREEDERQGGEEDRHDEQVAAETNAAGDHR